MRTFFSRYGVTVGIAAVVLFIGFMMFGSCSSCSNKQEKSRIYGGDCVNNLDKARNAMDDYTNATAAADAEISEYQQSQKNFKREVGFGSVYSGNAEDDEQKFNDWQDRRDYEKWKRCHPQDECNQDGCDQKKTEKVVAPKNSSKSKSKTSVSSTQKPTVNNYNYNYYYDREKKKETVEVKKSDCGCKKEDRVYNSPTSNDCECPSTPLPENYSDYNKSNLLSKTGCHGFREKGVNGKTEDFRFKNVEEARIFFDANQYGIFKGRQRNF